MATLQSRHRQGRLIFEHRLVAKFFFSRTWCWHTHARFEHMFCFTLVYVQQFDVHESFPFCIKTMHSFFLREFLVVSQRLSRSFFPLRSCVAALFSEGILTSINFCSLKLYNHMHTCLRQHPTCSAGYGCTSANGQSPDLTYRPEPSLKAIMMTFAAVEKYFTFP